MIPAKPARPAKKPSAAQIRVLARMVQTGSKIHVEAWGPTLFSAAGFPQPHPIAQRTFNALVEAGWVMMFGMPYGKVWCVSDAERKAAE